MRSGKRSGLVGAAAAGGSSVAVGSSVAASSILVSYPVAYSQALRYAIAAFVLFLFARCHLPRLTIAHLPMLVTLAGVGLAGFNVFLIAALKGGDAGTVGAIIGCVPIGLALAGPLLRKERYRPRVVIAAVVVAAGVFIVHGFGGAATLSSLIFALAAMLCEIGFSLLALHLLRDLGPVGLSTYASANGAVILVLGGLLIHGIDDISLSMSHDELLAVVYLALVSTAGAFVMWYSSLERLPVEIAGLFAGVVPIAALLTAVLVGSATLNAVRVLGALVVGTGVVLGLIREVNVPQRESSSA